MHKDTREELERLESELLADETQKLEKADDLDEFLEGLLDEPTDSLAQTGSIVYNNYANGYGQQEQEEPESEPESKPKRKTDKTTKLMFLAAGLMLGIAAVIVYWMVRFL